jgi:predicted MPP superfamily phosphohydrolase
MLMFLKNFIPLHEPLRIERLTIAIADLPSSLSGLKLVQLSDFHYDGVRLSEELLLETIEKTNQENPDLIVLTGDFITSDPEPIYQLADRLKRLKSQWGIYAILGNHEIYHPESKTIVTQALTDIGITVLWNSIAYPFGQDFPLVGLADFWSKEFNPEAVFSQLDPKLPRLVLCHNPDAAAQLSQWRVDLQLSGHTHGGQIVLPYFGAALVILRSFIKRFLFNFFADYVHVVHHWQWREGLHQIGANQLYVNRGLGAYFPGRLFCPPELTVISLQSSQKNSEKVSNKKTSEVFKTSEV